MTSKIISILGGIVVALLCIIDFRFRTNVDGHFVSLITDRPLSIIILIIVAGIAYWAHLTKRTIVRNIAVSALFLIVI